MCIQFTVRYLGLVALLSVLAGQVAAFSIEDTMAARSEKDAWMRDDARSPFNNEKLKVRFSPLHYYTPDANWVFESVLEVFAEPEAVTILDTKGRERRGHVYGFLRFIKAGVPHTIRVYRMETMGGHYYAITFTDKTTGDSTYEVGRYLDFELSSDPAHVYTLDFNAAYNPYCAYTPIYGCAIPRKEDFVDLAITAGEKKWHE